MIATDPRRRGRGSCLRQLQIHGGMVLVVLLRIMGTEREAGRADCGETGGCQEMMRTGGQRGVFLKKLCPGMSGSVAGVATFGKAPYCLLSRGTVGDV